MPKITIRTATKDDVYYIAEHMRQADITELRLSHSFEPSEVVRNSYSHSLWTKCALVDGRPAVLYGVSPALEPDCGVPWMLATDDILKIKKEFLDGSKSEVDAMRKTYRVLFNQVHKDNHIAIKWLRWLGFCVDPKPTGPLNEFFNFWTGALNV